MEASWVHLENSACVCMCVCSLDERTMSESDHEQMETDRADKSLFVQELILALLSDHAKLGEAVEDSATEETSVKASPQAKSEVSATMHPDPPRAATASNVSVDRVPAAVPRANRVPAGGAVLPVDGNRIVPNQSSASRLPTVKRKPLPAAARTGKDSMPAAASANKRH